MALSVATFMQELETLHGKEFTSVVQQKPFTLLFHDTTKLRVRTEYRDLSIPISILLLGIAQLLACREFDREMCLRLLGKEWGYGIVARLLLECDDVCLKAGVRGLALMRVRSERRRLAPIKAPVQESVALNPANGNGR